LAMQQTKAPDEVKEAFDDAIKAQQDEERFVNEAEVYANQNIPVAQGQANRMTQEAQAYKEQQVLKAKGSTARFDKLLPEYRRQPQVMRDRLYMDAMEDVLSKTNKVIVDGNVGNNMMVLPLDQLKSKKATKELGQPINISTPSNKVVKATQESQGKTDNRIRPLYEDINNYEASKGE
jgi:membrane protease subunit HflK